MATTDTTVKRRRKAGRYIARIRTQAGLSQLDLARRLGFGYYTFISQVETGRSRVPPDAIRDWASALQVDEASFARTLLRHYEPEYFKAILGDADAGDDRPSGRRDPVSLTEELCLALARMPPAALRDAANRLYDAAIDDLLASRHRADRTQASRTLADNHLRNTIASLIAWRLDRRRSTAS